MGVCWTGAGKCQGQTHGFCIIMTKSVINHDLHYFCFFLLYLFFFNMCMSEYLLMQDHECNVCGQNKILDSQELKLEVVESLLMWALGYELRSYVREMPAFSH